MACKNEIIKPNEKTENEEEIVVYKLNKESYDAEWLKGTAADSQSNKNKKDFSNPVYKKLAKINGNVNKMSLNDLIDTLDNLSLDTSGKKEVLVRRLKAHYKETNLKQSKVLDENHQTTKSKFDYVCVIDYEATCTENKIENYVHEIIQFPVVLVDIKELKIVDEFNSYCKPEINPKLTKFCTSLTGITQDNVEKSDTFPTVLEKVEKWLNEHELGTKYKFAVATDGPWDMQNFLNQQCYQSNIAYPRWARKWIDVRKMFSNWFGVKRCNIEKMLNFFGLEFEGQPHCGLDDAKNIARILLRLAKDGCEIKINSNIKGCLSQIGKNEKEENGENKASDESDKSIVFDDAHKNDSEN